MFELSFKSLFLLEELKLLQLQKSGGSGHKVKM
ncbi:MAG: hypothetical protein FD155_2722 [Bacteroidetes bacterium]|nr:MAG: hypothetical protein FD155_2722 [Bacteroidota bacterium]